jgi:hypothetical protein
MSASAKIEVALMLVLGISLVFLLPTLQLLPATTRAWRRAMALLPSDRWFARAVRKLPAIALSAFFARPSKSPALVSADIVSLDCSRLC